MKDDQKFGQTVLKPAGGNKKEIEYSTNYLDEKHCSPSNVHRTEELEFEDTVDWESEGGFDEIENEFRTEEDQILEKCNRSITSEVLDRAVFTASSMADWAGRAVRSALKEHSRSLDCIDDNNDDILFTGKEPFKVAVDTGINEKSIRKERCTENDPYIQPKGRIRAETLANEMRDDVIELLKAFDLPFIIAPYEAEAQCAVLDQLNLVDGVVTEDSDVFLFGARSVYRNIFQDKKYVEVMGAR